MSYCGRVRTNSTQDLTTQRNPPLKRTSLSRVLCERLAQTQQRPESARIALLRMERDGLIVLPPRRSTRVLRPVPRPNRRWPPTVRFVRCVPIRSTKEGKLWNAFICRYHYLGFTPMPGAQLRYFVRSAEGEPLAVLGFGAAAWKTAPQVLGSAASAPFVVNNARLLPWVKIKHIPCPRTGDVCSTTGTAVTLCVQHCLRPFAKASRELAAVQPTRVGKTQGRGKLDVKNEYALPVKDARPLRRDEGSQSQTITRVANAYLWGSPSRIV